MSRAIDERVVSMQFDNKQFENNVRTSLSTIEKLKQSLNFKGASKGIDNVNTAVKRCTLSPLSSAVDSVKVKFSAMEVMAVTALSRITNSAITTGKRMVSALTIDPVKTGLQEYETQINAIQTILANTESKGETLDTVNAALDELNTYADKTIYNFTEMTRNIGTFTAAGVGLKESTAAIKGIANLAAVSGSSSQQASTAMYQLSQALAAGRVSLMDWNSVVNAGMGGELFQNALKRTARQMGTGVDAAIKKYGTFRESLTQGQWLTTEVLTETLAQLSGAYTEADLIAQGYTKDQAAEIAKLADTAVNAATKVKTFTQLWDTLKESAQSGWTQTWELVIGDFGEAKTLWTAVSDEMGGIIGARSEKRNKFLSGALTSKWDRLTQKIGDAGIETEKFETTLKETAKSHGYNIDKLIEEHGSLEDAFRSGEISSKVLRESIKKLEGDLVDLSDIQKDLKKGSTGDDVKKVQKALKDLGYDIGKFGDGSGIDGIIGSVTEQAIKDFQKAQGLEVTGIIDEKTIEAIEKASGGVDGLYKSVKNLIGGIDELGGRELLLESFANIWKGLKSVLRPIRNAFKVVFPPATSEQLYKLIEGFHKLTENLTLSGGNAHKVFLTFRGLFSVLKIVTDVVGGGLKVAFKAFSKILGSLDLNILDVTSSIGDAIYNFRNWLTENDRLSKGFEKVIGWIVSGATAVRDWVTAFIELPVVQENLAKLRTAFSDFFGNLPSMFKDLGGLFSDFWKSFTSMDTISLDNIKRVFLTLWESIHSYFSNIENPFSGILNAAKSFKDGIVEYFGDSVEKLGECKNTIIEFVKVVKEKLGQNMGKILALGTLITFLLIVKKIKDAVETIAHPFDMIDDFLDGLGKSVKQFAKSIAIKNIASSIAILAASIAVLALLDPKRVWSSVGAIIVLGAGLVIMAKMMDKVDANDLSKLSLSLLAMGGALLLMAMSVKMIGGMSDGAWIKGTLSVAAFMGMMAVIAKTAKGLGRGVDDFGKMLLKLSGALLILAFVVKIFGSMDTGTLLKGGTAVSVFLLTMVGMMKLSSKIGKDSAKFGAMMFKLSGSLLLMSLAIKILGSMDIATMVKGGSAVAIFLGMMVGMMYATHLVGKGDIAKFGTMMLGIGTSLIMMGLAIKILAGISPGDIVKGELAILGMGGIIVGLMAATKLLGKYSFNSGKVGVMMIGFAAAVMMMSGSVLLLSMIDKSDLTKAMLAVTGIGAIMAGLIFVTKYAKSVKVGTILALSISIGILAAAVAALSFIDGTQLAGATAAITVITGMFALLAFSTKSLTLKSTVGLIIMTAVVGGLAFILYKLADLPADSALKIATALSELLLSLSISCAVLGAIGALGPMVLIGAGLLALVLGVLAGFAAIGIAALPKIGEKLAEFAENLGPFMDVAEKITPELGEGLKNLAIAIGVLTGTAFVDAIGSKIFGGSTLTDFGASLARFGRQLATFLRTVSEPFNEINSASGVPTVNMDNVNAAIDAGVRLSELANNIPDTSGLSTVFGKKDIGVFGDQISAFATGLVGFLQKVSAPFLTLSGNSGDGLTVETSTIDFDSVTSAVDVAVRLADIADTIPDTSGWSTIFGKKDLGVFGTQIANFASGLASYLVAMSDPIAKFNAESGDSTIADSEINWEDIGKATDVATKLAELAPNVPDTSEFGTIFENKDLGVFGNQIATFASGLATYLVAMSDPISKFNSGVADDAKFDGEINWEDIGKATDVATDLAAIATDIPDTSGWSTTFSNKNIGEFGDQIATFASGLASYLVAMSDPIKSLSDVGGSDGESSVDEVDWTMINKATGIAEDLANVANKIPDTSAWGETFSGTKNIGTFGSQIASFAKSLANYLVTMSDPIAAIISANAGEGTQVTADTINWDTIKKAAEVATDLADVANKIPDTSKWGELFSGNKNLGTFGTQIGTFASGLAKFLTDTNAAFTGLSTAGTGEGGASSINMENVSAAVDCAVKLSELAAAVSDNSKGWDWLTGKDDLGDFGSNLTDFATGLSGFSEGVGDLNTGAMTAAAGAAETIVGLATSISEGETANLVYIGSDIKTFGTDLGEFFSNLTLMDVAMFSTVATSIKNVVSFGKQISDLDFSGLEGLGTSLSKIGVDGVDEFIAAFKNAGPKLQAAGSGMVSMLAMGITTGSIMLIAMCKAMVSTAATAVSSGYTGFYNAGKNVVEGFANGITMNTYLATAKAKAMALKAYEAAKKALDINSPSKIFRSLGTSVPEGFAMGIDKLGSMVKSSAVGMADTAISGTKNAISRIAEAINSDIDAQPTIRPVLDLSDVTAGANSISGMFGMRPSVGVMSNIGAISSSMANRQNGTNSDVISAIEKLGNKLGNTSGDTYNFDGITYDDGSNISTAVGEIVRAAKLERRR